MGLWERKKKTKLKICTVLASSWTKQNKQKNIYELTAICRAGCWGLLRGWRVSALQKCILSLQNGNANGCCVVFLPWTFIPESSKIMSYCFSNIYFFSSALNKVVPTLLSSRINRGCVMGVWLELEAAQHVFELFLPEEQWVWTVCSHPLPESLNTRKWGGIQCGWSVWPDLDQNHFAARGQVQSQVM